MSEQDQPERSGRDKSFPLIRPDQAGAGRDVPEPASFDPNVPLPAVPPPAPRTSGNADKQVKAPTPGTAQKPATPNTEGSEPEGPTTSWSLGQRRGSLLRSLEAAQIPEQEEQPTEAPSATTQSSTPPAESGPTQQPAAAQPDTARAQRNGRTKHHGRIGGRRHRNRELAEGQAHQPDQSRTASPGPTVAPHQSGEHSNGAVADHSDGTTGLPATDAGRGVSTRTPQTAPLLRGLRDIIQGEDPPTSTFNIVDRLIGSPFAQAAARPDPQEEAEKEAETARRTLRFALDVAELMLRWGSGSQDVETSIIAVTASYGLRHVDVDITNQSIHLNWTPPEGMPVSVLRVVRSFSDNYKSLAEAHQLVSDIAAGRVAFEAAQARMRAIRRRRQPYSALVTFIASTLFSAMFVVFIGGTWRAATVALFTQAGFAAATRLGGRWRVPEFFSVATGTLIATITALLLYNFEIIQNPEMVVAGAIMLILPAGRFVSAVQDAIYGFPLTALSRLFSALIVYAAIITGVMAGAYSATSFGLNQLDLARPPSVNNLPFWLLALLAVVAVVSGAVVQQVAPRHLGAVALVVFAGYSTVWIFSQHLNVGVRTTPAIAAAVMGLLARLLATRLDMPVLILIVPSVVILLPGLAIFRSMYAMVQQAEGVSTSLAGMVVAFSIIMAIAVGAVLGDLLARPFTVGWNRATKLRFRRR